MDKLLFTAVTAALTLLLSTASLAEETKAEGATVEASPQVSDAQQQSAAEPGEAQQEQAGTRKEEVAETRTQIEDVSQRSEAAEEQHHTQATGSDVQAASEAVATD
jgi:hypothetical protein